MKKLLIILFICSQVSMIIGQEQTGSISVLVSTDTLYEGNVIGVKYVIENLVGDFVLDAAQVVTAEQNFVSDRVHVVVIDNPDGIIQDARSYKQRSTLSTALPITKKKMTKADSIRMKLRRYKSKKI